MRTSILTTALAGLCGLIAAVVAWVLWPQSGAAGPPAVLQAEAPRPASPSPPADTVSSAAAPQERETPAAAPDEPAGRRAADVPLRVLVVNTERDKTDTGTVDKLAQRLKAVVDIDIEIRHLSHVGADTVDKLHCDAVVLSGQGTPWWEYTERELAGVYALLRGARVPVLGICGGHQLIAKAFGGEVGLIRRLRKGDGYEGCERERGWLPIQLGKDPLFEGLGEQQRLWENHCEEVKKLPPGLIQIATDGGGAMQGMRHKDRPIYGVQFHPEVNSDSHRAGAAVLKGFFEMADEARRAGGDGT